MINTLVAYSGCLKASLTLPTRPPFIDTFKDLVDQREITIVGSYNAFMNYLNQSDDSIMMVWQYLWVLQFRTYLCQKLPFQDINKRMLKQGYNESHLYKPDFQGFTHKVLGSPNPVVRLQELTTAKQFNAIRFSTASGKCIAITWLIMGYTTLFERI